MGNDFKPSSLVTRNMIFVTHFFLSKILILGHKITYSELLISSLFLTEGLPTYQFLPLVANCCKKAMLVVSVDRSSFPAR